MEHRPLRPEWICAGDGERWPCLMARTILAGYQPDREELARHLLRLITDAADDLAVGPTRLYRRFVGWTLSDESACRLCGRDGHDVLSGVPPRLFPCDGAAADAEGVDHPHGRSTTSARRA